MQTIFSVQPTRLFFVLLLSLGLFSACNREDDEPVQQVLDSAEDNSIAENEYSAIYSFVEEQAENISVGKTASDSLLPECATVNIEEDNTQENRWLITIDFGPENCLCQDGYYRRGKVMVDFQGQYRQEGTTWSLSTEDYYFNDYKLEGTKTVTNLGNESGNYRYSVNVDNARIVFPGDTAEITWNSDRVRERIAGEGTLTPWDDIYVVTGNSSGVNRRGQDFTADITQELKFDMDCLRNGRNRHFKSGRIELSSGGNSLTLDYDPVGGEPCDKIASIQWNDRDPNQIILR